LGAASVGLGVYALLDAYWRSSGVALAYPPLLSGWVGRILLLVGIVLLGIGSLVASRQATAGGGRAPDRVSDAKKAEHDERA
jgi:hypothetical protein